MNRSVLDNPKIAIIIPCWNASSTLDRTLQSVQAQTYKNWQIILIDDGSNPEHQDQYIKITSRFDAVTYLKTDQNMGPAKARNLGIDEAVADYIAFLDADDTWAPTKLEQQLAFMLAEEIDFSYTPYANVAQNGTVHPLPCTTELAFSSLLQNTAIACSSVVLDAKFLGEKRFPAAPVEDIALWAALLRNGSKAYKACDDIQVFRTLGGRSRNQIKAAARYWRTLKAPIGLPLPQRLWTFSNYAVRAAIKHRKTTFDLPSKSSK